jgi:uncharacterized protein
MEQAIQAPAVPQTSAPPAAPVRDANRIDSLDLLRGFALLGILVMNIQAFGMVFAAYDIPTVYGDLTGANYWVWYLSHMFADMKFMSIFSMLFGAGIVLMTSRQEATSGRPAWFHYRRMGALLLFGLLHAYLLWFGDILVCYALCGMVAYPFRKARPWLSILLGFLIVAVPSVLMFVAFLTIPYWSEDVRQEVVEGQVPQQETIEAENRAYQGAWVEEFKHRWPVVLRMQTVGFVFLSSWRAGGLMLIGMGLFRMGVFSCRLPGAIYISLIAAALFVGFPVIAYGAQREFTENWDPLYTFFAGAQYNYWGSFLVCLGYASVIMLISRQTVLFPFTRPLAAVGQMAFTNYLLQTLICTTLFYGYGFGLFGKVGRVGQIAIVFAIWIFQLGASPLWLRYFLFGPAEWLWRVLTYGQLHPFRRA